MKATPLVCGHLDYQSQGSHVQPFTKGPAYADRPGRCAPLGLPASFPPRPPPKGRGQRELPVRLGKGMSFTRSPSNLARLAEPSRAPAPRPSHRERAGAAIGRGRLHSVGEPGRRGGKEVAAAALHQPCSASRRLSPGAQSRVEGHGAGTHVPTPPQPAPLDPEGRRPPCLPAGRRSVPGGSPPPPRPLRSRGGSGPAREAGPGAPAGTRGRTALGRGLGR